MVHKKLFDLSFSSLDNSNNIIHTNDTNDTNYFVKQFIKKLLNNIYDTNHMKDKEKRIGSASNNLKNVISYLDNSNKLDKIGSYIYTNKRTDISHMVANIHHEYERCYDFNIYGCKNQTSLKLVNDDDSIIEKSSVKIEMEIHKLQDLIDLIDKYPLTDNVVYNVNIEPIHNIKDNLIELNNMIGMRQLKTNIVDQILYFIQDLHTIQTKNNTNNDFMHTVIYGPPGTGKTEIAKIMGSIYSKLGILKKGTYKKVTRSDMIAGYLGQTALKTRDLIKDNLDGVLFIDEAYALGNKETKDSFAKECIDTLCEALSDHKDRIMVIIAGYEDELQECFFKYNKGLESRFIWRFNTDDYTANELKQIFIKKVNESGWTLVDEISTDWFESKMDYFKYYGRDMETLFAKIKIAHAKRVFLKSPDEKTKLIQKDLERGFKMYLLNEEVKSRKEDKLSLSNTLYL
jgi:SpoVK/Ycf46/Vps4 family AAA+-type ATPase